MNWLDRFPTAFEILGVPLELARAFRRSLPDPLLTALESRKNSNTARKTQSVLFQCFLLISGSHHSAATAKTPLRNWNGSKPEPIHTQHRNMHLPYHGRASISLWNDTLKLTGNERLTFSEVCCRHRKAKSHDFPCSPGEPDF